jgi:hypothetical protein
MHSPTNPPRGTVINTPAQITTGRWLSPPYVPNTLAALPYCYTVNRLPDAR